MTHLLPFLPSWQKITSDHWALSVIQTDYTTEFVRPPSPTMSSFIATSSSLILEAEGITLLAKGVIETVLMGEECQGLYSRYSMVLKKDGDLRPILNLRELNGLSEISHGLPVSYHALTLQG